MDIGILCASRPPHQMPVRTSPICGQVPIYQTNGSVASAVHTALHEAPIFLVVTRAVHLPLPQPTAALCRLKRDKSYFLCLSYAFSKQKGERGSMGGGGIRDWDTCMLAYFFFFLAGWLLLRSRLLETLFLQKDWIPVFSSNRHLCPRVAGSR